IAANRCWWSDASSSTSEGALSSTPSRAIPPTATRWTSTSSLKMQPSQARECARRAAREKHHRDRCCGGRDRVHRSGARGGAQATWRASPRRGGLEPRTGNDKVSPARSATGVQELRGDAGGSAGRLVHITSPNHLHYTHAKAELAAG